MTDITATLELAKLAMRLEHLNARVATNNVARLGAGSPTLFAAQLDVAYAAMQASAVSPQAATAFAAAGNADPESLAGVREIPTPATASADDLILQLNQTASRYGALADGIGRQYNLMALAIRGAR